MDQASPPASLAMTPPEIKRPARKISDEKWEEHRDFIAGMYPIAGMNLKKVIEMLEQDHGFIVTERQLKRKIEKWHLDKNVKRSEMEFIAYKQQQRIQAGRLIKFRARGQPVKQAKIERWQKRTGVSTQVPLSPAPPTPTDVSYSPASVRSPLDAPIIGSPMPDHASMNWAAEMMPPPLAPIEYKNAHLESLDSESLDLARIIGADTTVFEGQSPAPFTPLPSPAPSPKSPFAQIHHPSNFSVGATLHSQSSNMLQSPSLGLHNVSHQPYFQTAGITELSTEPSVAGTTSQELTTPTPSHSNAPRRTRYMHKEEIELRQRLDDFRSKLGPNHPATLDTMSRLAWVLIHQCRFRSAESLISQLAETRHALLGGDNTETIQSFLDLAILFIKQSKLLSAEKLFRRLHSKALTLVPPTHILSLTIKNYLAWCLYFRGSMQEAEQLFRESIRLGGTSLQADDDQLLLPMEGLAGLLLSRGELSEAERILDEILQADEGLKGSKHEYTLRTRSALGEVYCSQGEYQKAETTLRQVVIDQTKLFGLEHDNTLITQSRLSSTLAGLGRHQECDTLRRDAFEKSKRSLGSNHVSTLGRQINVAVSLNGQGRYEEAEGILREVKDRSEKALGPDHVVFCQALNELGRSYEGQGRLDDALLAYGNALEKSLRLRGPNHVDTVGFRGNFMRVQEQVSQA